MAHWVDASPTLCSTAAGGWRESPSHSRSRLFTCRSRTKNMMWYGVLGTKELLHRTYKNLEQKVLLEVSGTVPALRPSAVGSPAGPRAGRWWRRTG